MKTKMPKLPFKKAMNILRGYMDKAGDVARHAGSLRVLISRARRWLKKASAIPGVGALVEDWVDMLDLLTDYANGSYRKVPFRLIVAATACLLYVVSPVNLIPNWVPLLGMADDLAIVSCVMDLGLSAELKKYKGWRLQKQAERQSGADAAVEPEAGAEEHGSGGQAGSAEKAASSENAG